MEAKDLLVQPNGANMTGKLKVILHRGVELTNMDIGKAMDPYCLLRVNTGQEQKSSVKNEGGSNPTWEETFEWDIAGYPNERLTLHIKCRDEDTVKDDDVGRADLDIRKVIWAKPKTRFQLVSTTNFRKITGYLELTVTFEGTGQGPPLSAEETLQLGSLPPELEDFDQKDARGPGKLTITIHDAHFLKDADFWGKCDPYVLIDISHEKHATRFIQGGGTRPVWEETFVWRLKGTEPTVSFLIKDKDVVADDKVGIADVMIDRLIIKKGKQAIQLINPSDPKEIAGYINVTASWEHTGVDVAVDPSAGFARLKSDFTDEDPDFDWDWCFVFDTGSEHLTVKNMTQTTWFAKRAGKLVEKLLLAGLKVFLYKNSTQDYVICLVGASERRLEKEAARIRYELELSRDKIYEIGMKHKLKLSQACEDTPDQKARFTKEIFTNMFAGFRYPDRSPEGMERYDLWRRYEDEGAVVGRPSIFRNVERIKLIHSIMESEEKTTKGGDQSKKFGCANLPLSKYMLSEKHPLEAYFPLHQEKKKQEIEEAWLSVGAIFSQPLNKVRHYYGEQVAFYFAFLQFYSRWLVLPALAGLLTALWQYITGNMTVPVYPAYGLFTALWAAFFLESWKRRQATLTMEWGQSHFLEREQSRPEFKGEWLPNPVDGQEEEEYPIWKKTFRLLLSHSVIATLIGVVVASVTGIFVLRVLARDWNSQYGPYFVSFLNAIQIMILNKIYAMMALKLTDFENHRTQSQYENSLITKTFLFKFVNSYNTLFYLAFVKQYGLGREECPSNNCLPELRGQLAMIFITQVLLRNLVEWLQPRFEKWQKQRNAKEGLSDEEKQHITPAEHQFFLLPYDSTYEEFDQIVVQFGYATLFVTSFPLAPLFALIGNFIEIRLDAVKLCKMSRRPIPKGAQNIGTWYHILNVLSYIAIVTNCAVIVFSSDADDRVSQKFANFSTTEKFLFFILAEHLIILLKKAIDFLIPDIPAEVKNHDARQAHVENILLNGVKEDDDVEEAEDEEEQLVFADIHSDGSVDQSQPTEHKREVKQDSEAERIGRLYNLDKIPNQLPEAEWNRAEFRKKMLQESGGKLPTYSRPSFSAPAGVSSSPLIPPSASSSSAPSSPSSSASLAPPGMSSPLLAAPAGYVAPGFVAGYPPQAGYSLATFPPQGYAPAPTY